MLIPCKQNISDMIQVKTPAHYRQFTIAAVHRTRAGDQIEMLLRLSRLKLPNSSLNLKLLFFLFPTKNVNGRRCTKKEYIESIRGFLVLNGPFWANFIVGPPSLKFVLFFLRSYLKLIILFTRLIFNCHFIAPLTSVYLLIFICGNHCI